MADDMQSGYLDHLPAAFREHDFLGRFLLAFEALLSQAPEAELSRAVEEVIDRIDAFFRPLEAPAEFLPWLAGWVALSLRADLDEPDQRAFIARVAPLYRWRGTKRGLEELIRVYTQLAPTIHDSVAPLQIGVHSSVGTDTVLGGGPPRFFRVTVRLGAPHPEERRRMQRVIEAIIDAEKPAHTYYALNVETPAMQIGEFSTVGVDTLLSPVSR